MAINRFLNDEQQYRVRAIGRARHNPTIGNRGGLAGASVEEQINKDIEGAGGECWLAENYLGEPWQATLEVRATDHTDAKGRHHEVKTTPIGCGQLIVRDKSPRPHIHHLVVGSITGGYQYVGMIDGIDVPRASLRGWGDPDGRGECYTVVQNRLYKPRAEGDDEQNEENAKVVLKAMRRVGRENLGCRPGLKMAYRLYKTEIQAMLEQEKLSC
jgi:hypothetical protein